MNKGKFIVVYGINNLGKTTQAKLLVEKLIREGHRAEYLKYGVYNIIPSGILLEKYLRKGNPHNLLAREFQIIQVLNKTQFESTLKEKLNSGINIIAEDYVGTGLAWGIGAGISEKFLEFINSHLLKEDLVLLLDGERFKDAIEANHIHEEDEGLTARVRQIHLDLAKKYNWFIINANQKINVVHNLIWQEVKKII
jgi:dTMP kinase